MNFKDFYLIEGRNAWNIFKIKMNDKKWSFRNLETNQLYFIKINENNVFDSLIKFLKDIEATPPTIPKTKGIINYDEFANNIMKGKYATVFVKSGMFEKIKNTWVIE
jgi:hypothetical protein